jgi:hypothetical protein
VLPILALTTVLQHQQDRQLVEDAMLMRANREKAAAQPRHEAYGQWNAGFKVLFKGQVFGTMVAPDAQGVPQVTLMVKSSNGGLSEVLLGPKDYVDAQGLRFNLKAPIWVAGSKTWDGDSWVILAQRLNVDHFRPSFRRKDGTPYWQ